MIRKHMIFHGWVQGVGFRWRARQAADLYDCTGWVRKHCMGNTDGRSVIGYDVFIKRQEDYHDENSERSIGAIRRLSGYASLLR